MNDILPDEIGRWHRLEAAFRARVELYGFSEVRTPLLEPTPLFVRQVGETTDIVEKEMYSFSHHGETLTLRPEGTAGAARAYVEHAVHAREPVTRWYYLGAMFRGERPAKGRFRQFHQAGCEHLGDPGPLADAEMIEMLAWFFDDLGVPHTVHLNSIGGAGTRERYRALLLEYLAPRRAELSEDSQRRLERNPLRIVDSKDPRDVAIVAGAPSLDDVLDDADRAHFAAVCSYLDGLSVRYVVDPRLVRGLDYYTRTMFEFRSTAPELGAQNSLLGGGRYDRMIEELGGPSVPALGFAMGLERVISLLPADTRRRGPGCYIAPLGERACAEALPLARELRARGVVVEVDGRGGRLRAMLRRADAMGARLCLLLGDEEAERGVITVKDLVAHAQDEVPRTDAARILADRIAVAALGSAS